MVVNLFIRRAKDNPSKVTVKSSLCFETHDTPRIVNLSREIKQELDAMIERCEKTGVISYKGPTA